MEPFSFSKNNNIKEYSYSNDNNPLSPTQINKSLKYLYFEKVVIDNLDPEKHNLEGLYFFKEFNNCKSYIIPKFISKDNKNMSYGGNQINIKSNLKNKSFLLKQIDIFSNNLIDAIFINVNENNEAELFCFHISAKEIKNYKKLSIKSLQKNFEKISKNINKFFDFKIISIYFNIIFDYNLTRRDISKMIKNLEENSIKYIFFDLSSLAFKDINGYTINIIKGINNLEIYNKKISKNNFELNNEQKGTIKEILRKVYKKIDSEFLFFKSDILYTHNLNINKNFYITEQPKNIFKTENPETYMLFKGKDKKLNFVKLNKEGGYEAQSELIYDFCSQNDYDYYKIE